VAGDRKGRLSLAAPFIGDTIFDKTRPSGAANLGQPLIYPDRNSALALPDPRAAASLYGKCSP